jgi:hypothetical protein
LVSPLITAIKLDWKLYWRFLALVNGTVNITHMLHQMTGYVENKMQSLLQEAVTKPGGPENNHDWSVYKIKVSD